MGKCGTLQHVSTTPVVGTIKGDIHEAFVQHETPGLSRGHVSHYFNMQHDRNAGSFSGNLTGNRTI